MVGAGAASQCAAIGRKRRPIAPACGVLQDRLSDRSPISSKRIAGSSTLPRARLVTLIWSFCDSTWISLIANDAIDAGIPLNTLKRCIERSNFVPGKKIADSWGSIQCFGDTDFAGSCQRLHRAA